LVLTVQNSFQYFFANVVIEMELILYIFVKKSFERNSSGIQTISTVFSQILYLLFGVDAFLSILFGAI